MKTRLPRYLNFSEAEAGISAFATAKPEALQISLDQIRRCEFMAETRLMPWLASARQQRLPVEAETRFRVDFASGESKRLVSLLSDTLGGLILAQLSDRLVDGSGSDCRGDAVRRQAERAVATGGFYGYGSEQAAPIVDLFGGPPAAQIVKDNVAADFDGLFRDWLSRMNLADLTTLYLENLIEFAYEAFDNARRHGAVDLDRRAVEGVRFILMRNTKMDLSGSRERVGAVGAGVLQPYLARLAQERGGTAPVFELSIGDCGVGIPATLAGDLAVYSGPWEDERALAVEAFLDNRTRRTRVSGAGRGLGKLLRAATAMRGWVSLRTGRTHLYRDCDTAEGWQFEEVAFLPGTSVSLICRWDDPSQLALALDS